MADRVSFEVAPASAYSGNDYDLVTMFDCLHDMGDPVGAARHVRSTLSPDGTWMIVEPNAGDRVEDNLNPVGRAYYAFSTLLCTPASLSQEVGLALGAQAGEARIRDVVAGGRIHAIQARGRDAVQPRVRSAAVTASADAELTAPASGGNPRGRRSARADPRALPGRRGLCRTRRCADLLGALRRRRAHGAAAADVVDRAFAPLEAADPVSRTAFSGDHLRWTGKRPVRPAGWSRRPTRTDEFAADALAVIDATATASAVAARGVVRRAVGDDPRRRSSGAGRRGRVRRPGRGACARQPRPREVRVRRAARHRRRVGEVQPPLLARGLPRLLGVLLRPVRHRAALEQADRGLRRRGHSRRPGDARRHDARARHVARREPARNV